MTNGTSGRNQQRHDLQQAAASPLADHLKDWKGNLIAAGNTPEYAACRHARVTRVFDGCGLVQWSDLKKPGAASAILCFLGAPRKKKRGKEGGISGASVNHYCKALRGFGNWMVEDKRATHNPLANLSGVHDAESDSNHERRHLTLDELKWLLATTVKENVTRDVPAEDRCRFYRFQYEAGLRPGQTVVTP